MSCCPFLSCSSDALQLISTYLCSSTVFSCVRPVHSRIRFLFPSHITLVGYDSKQTCLNYVEKYYLHPQQIQHLRHKTNTQAKGDKQVDGQQPENQEEKAVQGQTEEEQNKEEDSNSDSDLERNNKKTKTDTGIRTGSGTGTEKLEEKSSVGSGLRLITLEEIKELERIRAEKKCEELNGNDDYNDWLDEVASRFLAPFSYAAIRYQTFSSLSRSHTKLSNLTLEGYICHVCWPTFLLETSGTFSDEREQIRRQCHEFPLHLPLTRFTHLQSLTISRCCVTDKMMMAITTNLIQLHTLHLIKTRIGDPTAHDQVQDESVVKSLIGLNRFPHLTSLRLPHYYLSDQLLIQSQQFTTNSTTYGTAESSTSSSSPSSSSPSLNANQSETKRMKMECLSTLRADVPIPFLSELVSLYVEDSFPACSPPSIPLLFSALALSCSQSLQSLELDMDSNSDTAFNLVDQEEQKQHGQELGLLGLLQEEENEQDEDEEEKQVSIHRVRDRDSIADQLSSLTQLRHLNLCSLQVTREEQNFDDLTVWATFDEFMLEKEQEGIAISQARAKAKLITVLKHNHGWSAQHLQSISSLTHLNSLSLGQPCRYDRAEAHSLLASYLCHPPPSPPPSPSPLSHLTRLQLRDEKLGDAICQIIASAVLGKPVVLFPLQSSSTSNLEQHKINPTTAATPVCSNSASTSASVCIASCSSSSSSSIASPSAVPNSNVVSFPFEFKVVADVNELLLSNSHCEKAELFYHSEFVPKFFRTNALNGMKTSVQMLTSTTTHAHSTITSTSTSVSTSTSICTSSTPRPTPTPILTHASSLTDLDLLRCGLSDLGLAYLSLVPSLRKLAIGESGNPNDFVMSLGSKAFRGEVSRRLITDVGIEMLCNGIPKLQSLNVTGPNYVLTDDMLAHIGRLQHLTDLTLDFICQPTGFALRTHLSLPNAPSLRSFSFSYLSSVDHYAGCEWFVTEWDFLCLTQLKQYRTNRGIVRQMKDELQRYKTSIEATQKREQQAAAETKEALESCLLKGVCTLISECSEFYPHQEFFRCRSAKCQLHEMNGRGVCKSCAIHCHSDPGVHAKSGQILHLLSPYPSIGGFCCDCSLTGNCKWQKEAEERLKQKKDKEEKKMEKEGQKEMELPQQRASSSTSTSSSSSSSSCSDSSTSAGKRKRNDD